MQTSVPGEIRWRLDLFRRSFEVCQRGELSFARLLALVVERLRLAVGDRAARVRAPVAITDDVSRRLVETIPRILHEAPTRSVTDRERMRRAIRLSQIDANISPSSVLNWLDTRADDWLSLIVRIQRCGLAEIGRGEGGLETAYLVHLVLLGEVRRILDADDASDATRAWVAASIDLAFEALVNTTEVSDAVPLRLALQTGTTTSALALGAEGDRLVRRPLSPYRTHPTAVHLARKVIVEPVELIPLDRVVETIARRLAVDEGVRTSLLEAALTELVRDASLLVLMQSYRPDRKEALAPLLEVLSSEASVTQTVLNEARRNRFVTFLEGMDTDARRPKEALLALLAGAERVSRGDESPLGVHGDPIERATTAARGAILFVLESNTAAILQTASSPIVRVDEQTFESGGCYRIGLDDQPLYILSSDDCEAVVVVDARQLAERGYERGGAKSAEELVRRFLFDPAMELAKRVGAAGRDVRCVACDQDEIAFAGDIVGIIALAEAIDSAVFSRVTVEFERETEDALGRSSRADEIAAETQHIEDRLAALARAANERRGDAAAQSMLEDGRRLLVEQREQLAAAQNEVRPPAPVIRLSIAHGDVGVSASVGDDVVMFSEPLYRAREDVRGIDVDVSGVSISAEAVDAYARVKRDVLERSTIEMVVDGERRTYVFFHSANEEIRLVLERVDDKSFDVVCRHDADHDSLVAVIRERTWT